jgi:hypothetical protein
MAKKASDKLSTPAEEALKRQKKQARQEAKLMLEIEEAKKQLKNAQKKQSKAQTLVEARSTYVQSLEARLTELLTPIPEPEIETPPQSAEIEHQQEQSETESGFASSHEQQLVSPNQEDQGEITSLPDEILASPQEKEGTDIALSSSEVGTSTPIQEEQTPPFVEESTPPEIMVVNNEVTERENAQDNGIATETEPAPTSTTPRKAPARKTTVTRKPAATRRPASNTRSSKQSPSNSE